MKTVVATIGVVVLCAAPAFAQGGGDDGRSNWSVSAGMGFTADPETFLMNFEAEYHVTENVSIGPVLQIGAADLSIIAPYANARFRFPAFSKDDDFLGKLRLSVQAGLGLAYYSAPGAGSTGMLLNFGGGLEYALTDGLSLHSRMLFNVLPVDAFGDNFYYSWEIIGARYRF